MFDSLFEENKKLHLRIKELERREDESNQYSRINCIEINGIPEIEKEDVLEVVKSVGRSLDVALTEESVDACHRLGPKHRSGIQPRGIIVKFTRRIKKEEFLKQRRVKRDLNTHDVGYVDNPAEIVYINESLTKARREVYKEVRTLKKTYKYSYVWVRGGTILVRPTEGARIIAVTTMEDLEKLPRHAPEPAPAPASPNSSDSQDAASSEQ